MYVHRTIYVAGGSQRVLGGTACGYAVEAKQGCPRFNRFDFVTNCQLRSIDSIDSYNYIYNDICLYKYAHVYTYIYVYIFDSIDSITCWIRSIFDFCDKLDSPAKASRVSANKVAVKMISDAVRKYVNTITVDAEGCIICVYIRYYILHITHLVNCIL